MERRVTVRDIAAEVGLHFTTVAEALRDSPRVKEETKRRVQEAADRMGYRVDPMLTALSAYRRGKRQPVYQGNLAWINGFGEPDFFVRNRGFYSGCFAGAKKRGSELGYRLESFWLAEPRMSAPRASRILRSRNMAGVIVGPMPLGVDELNLQWDKFCSVRIGYSVRALKLTTVVSDQFSNMRWLYEKMLGLGFRRIGFACPQLVDDRVNNRWSGAYLSMQTRYGRQECLEPFFDDEIQCSKAAFLRWHETTQPDVIITGGGTNYYEFLLEDGISVPEEVQLVSIHAEGLDNPQAGIRQNSELVGMVSVDQLVGVIHRFFHGLEPYPKTVTVRGEWKDGISFDARLAPASGPEGK